MCAHHLRVFPHPHVVGAHLLEVCAYSLEIVGAHMEFEHNYFIQIIFWTLPFISKDAGN